MIDTFTITAVIITVLTVFIIATMCSGVGNRCSSGNKKVNSRRPINK